MESLRRYDDNYFRFYPYLERHVYWNALRGKRVLNGYRGTFRDGETAAYDKSQDGALAPATEFVSVKSLRVLCKGYSHFNATTENADRKMPFRLWSRDELLASPIPRLCGLDVYWTCFKSDE